MSKLISDNNYKEDPGVWKSYILEEKDEAKVNDEKKVIGGCIVRENNRLHGAIPSVEIYLVSVVPER